MKNKVLAAFLTAVALLQVNSVSANPKGAITGVIKEVDNDVVRIRLQSGGHATFNAPGISAIVNNRSIINKVVDVTSDGKMTTVEDATNYWLRDYSFLSCQAYVYADGMTTNKIYVGESKAALVYDGTAQPQYSLFTASGKIELTEEEAAPILGSVFCFESSSVVEK